MKKKLLWIVPAAVILLLLIGLGIYLDYASGVKPLPEVIPSGAETQLSTLPDASEQTVPSEPEQESSSVPQTQDSASEEETEPSTQTPSSQPTQPQPTQPQPTQPSQSSESEDADLAAKQARIDELVAEVYALRDYYTAQLAALEAAAIAEYEALPPAERTPSRKQDIAFACIDAAYALEDECDARMDAICQELSYLLLETGGSMSLVTDIRYAYASEKETARSVFLEKYADYFG